MKNEPYLIIYDDECVMCNNFINFVVSNDNGLFKLASRNSEFFKNKNLLTKDEQLIDSLILLIDSNVYMKAEAIAKILYRTSFMGKIASALISLFPRFIANKTYDFIAKKRKSLFAKKHTICKINTQISSRILN